jgi:DNA-binding GntR family transcriptional regulator
VNTIPGALITAQQHALTWLRQLIVAGELRPGQRVNQEDLAERAGLSVAPVREALRALEQEGQVTYLPRRGDFVTDLRIDDLREIYELRRILEERAVRASLPALDDESLACIRRAAADCVDAVNSGDVASELAANRRFHFEIMDAASQPHTLRLIRLLWESTETYRALYYNSPDERVAAIDAHDRMLDAIARRDADRLVAELDEHRQRALDVLASILGS